MIVKKESTNHYGNTNYKSKRLFFNKIEAIPIVDFSRIRTGGIYHQQTEKS
jgi:hypothetical protein